MVNFQHLNLIEDNYPSYLNNTYEMDIIMCRNVTIYFKTETAKDITNRFYRCLVDGGYLIIGHSEPGESVFNEFKRIMFHNAVIYQKQKMKEGQAKPGWLSNDILKLKIRYLKDIKPDVKL